MASRTAGGYLVLWRTPRLPVTVLLAFLARLPLGMTTVGLLLLVRQTSDTFAVAGLAVAGFAVAAAVSSPTKGTLLDRLGYRPVLSLTALVMAGGLAALVWLRPTTAFAVIALGVVVGIGMPPVSAAVRAGFAHALSGDALRAAYGLDAVAMEFVYLGGPALVGLIIAVGGGPGAGLLVAAALTAVATIGFAMVAEAGDRPQQADKNQRLGRAPLGRAVMLAVAAAVPQAAALGLGEVVVTAAAVTAGQQAAVGPLLAVWAAGSIVGGLLFGAVPWSWSSGRQYAVLLAALALGLALLVVPDSLFWLGVTLFVAGLPTSAAWAAGAAVVAGGPESERGRAYGWLQGTTNAGAAGGYAFGGVAVGWAGLGTSYLIGAVLAGVACATVLGISDRSERSVRGA